MTDDYTTCEETEEMISEAMNLPEEQRERRLEEIEQHVRFLKADEKRKKIMNEKNHRRKLGRRKKTRWISMFMFF